MRKKLAFAAVALLGIAPAAPAALVDQHDPALDIVIDIPTFGPLSAPGGTFTHTVNVDAEDVYEIVGFSFEAHWDTEEIVWASDTELTIDGPGGDSLSIGGFPPENEWDFQGNVSAPDGFYQHGLNSPFGDGNLDPAIAGWDGAGEWSFTFLQTFLTVNEVSDGVFTIHQIPAPGALALFGLAGLVGARRRRD